MAENAVFKLNPLRSIGNILRTIARKWQSDSSEFGQWRVGGVAGDFQRHHHAPRNPALGIKREKARAKQPTLGIFILLRYRQSPERVVAYCPPVVAVLWFASVGSTGL